MRRFFRSEVISVGVFLVAIVAIAVVGGFAYGVKSAIDRNTPYQLLRKVKDDVSLVLRELRAGGDADFTQVVAGDGAGTTLNDVGDDGALALMAGFFEGGSQVRIVARDGTVLRKWPVAYGDFFAIDDPNALGQRTDIHGVAANPDGSIVFNFEYGGLVKLDACGGRVWTLDHPTHHSVQHAAGGGYWVPGRIAHRDNVPMLFPPFTETARQDGFDEDLILRVSEDGEIIEERSVTRILYDAGLEAALTATGYRFEFDSERWDRELVHLNKIDELGPEAAARFDGWQAGFLVLSLRTHNMLVVVNPSDWSVVWHAVGPWLRQHDPDFQPDGTITLFNNNAYAASTVSRRDQHRSNIMRVDPIRGVTTVALGQGGGAEFFSTFRGKHQAVGRGFLVTEAEGGRVFQTDGLRRIVWEYVNRIGEGRVGEVNDALLLPRDYFDVDLADPGC